MKHFIVCLQKFADFSGRATRAEFWYFLLFNWLGLMALVIFEQILGMPVFFQELGMISTIYYYVMLIPALSVSWRRAHDTGRSGWYSLVPFYNFYLMLIEGEHRRNEYGPNPYGDDYDEYEDDFSEHLIE